MRPIVVVALTLLAAFAVIGGALGVRSLAATANMDDLAAAAAPVTVGAATGLGSTDLGAGGIGLAPERAAPVDQDLPAAVGRTVALVVLLGAVLLLRRHPAAASIAGSSRPRPPRSGPTARSALPGVTPGLLRV